MVKITVNSEVGRILTSVRKKFPGLVRTLEREILKSAEPYVPYNTGRLCRSGTAVGSGEHGEVRYTADYALKCYYANRTFNKKKHPRACARWFEAAKASDLDNWIKSAHVYFENSDSTSEDKSYALGDNYIKL